MVQSNLPTDHHRRLNILAGTWDTSIILLESDGSDGEASQAIDTYFWMPNRQFLIHDVDAMMGGQHVRSTEIFGVDQASRQFFSRSYDHDGSTNDFVSRIEGNDYAIIGQIQRFSGRFSENGRMLQGEWRQFHEGDWRPFVRITLRKRSQADRA